MIVRKLIGIAIGSAIAVLLQWLFFGRLIIWGAFPDIVLLYVAGVALRTGRLSGSLTGFATGFLLDALYGSWGVQMIVKTIMGFVTGLFATGEGTAFIRTPLSSFATGFVVALVQNGLLVLLILLQSGARSGHLVVELWIASTLYTAAVAVLASLVWHR